MVPRQYHADHTASSLSILSLQFFVDYSSSSFPPPLSISLHVYVSLSLFPHFLFVNIFLNWASEKLKPDIVHYNYRFPVHVLREALLIIT